MKLFTTSFLKTFRRDAHGSVAVEAAIVMPIILLPLLYGSIDLGISVNASKNLTASTRAGAQYLLKGGRNTSELTSVLVSSFDGEILAGAVNTAAYCACPNAAAIAEPVEGQNTPLPYNLRQVTLETIAQCTVTCPDASRERVLVNLTIDYTTSGFYKDYDLTKTVSVRIR